MSTVIRQVVAEIRAKSDQFDAELKRIEGELAKTKRSTEGVGAAAELSGQKFAQGARQVASATETMARMGKVTGETAKQVVANASNMAFAFGPQGAVVGAIGIATLAIVALGSRAKEELRELERATRQTLDSIAAMDSKGLGERGKRLREGGFSPWDVDRIWDNTDDDARRRELLRARGLDRLRRDVVGRERMTTGAAGTDYLAQRRYSAQRAAIDSVIKEMELELRTVEQLERAHKKTEDAAQAALDAEKAGAEARREAAREAKRAAEEHEKALRDTADQIADFMQRELGTAADALASSFNELIAKAEKAGFTGRKDKLIELRDRAIAAAQAIAQTEQLLTRLDFAEANGVAPTVETFVALNDEVARLNQVLGKFVPGSQRYLAVQEELLKVEKKRKELLDGIADASDGKGGTPKAKDAAAYARELQQAADGALQLAQNLGGASEQATTLLRAIGQIAGNLPALGKALSSGSAGGIISSVLAIAGAVSSIVGPDPADEARKRALEENTQAIRDLTAKAGLLGVGGTGSQVSGARAQLQRFLQGYAPGIGQVEGGGTMYSASSQARVAAKAFGINITELEKLAAEYGIAINGNIRSFQQLLAALDRAAVKLAEFGDDLDSQRQQAAAAAKIFGITDPQQLLALTKGSYAGRSPVLDQALAGLDLSTAEGRQAAREALQGIFSIMQSGGDRLSAAQLGGLSGDDLLQAILDLIDGLNAVDDSLGLNTSTVSADRGDRVVRASETQITADQASRLLGVTTGMAADVRIIRQAIEAATTPLAIPSLAAGFASPAAGGITITVHQEFHGAVSPRDVQRATSDALVEAFDRALGRRILVQKRHVGDAVS